MPKGPFIPCDLTPEDRARGCVWASSFRSAADEVAKAGTITGTPVVQRGVTLDGVSDYLTYNLNSQIGYDGTRLSGGIIKSLKFYNALLTEDEHLNAYYQGGS